MRDSEFQIPTASPTDADDVLQLRVTDVDFAPRAAQTDDASLDLLIFASDTLPTTEVEPPVVAEIELPSPAKKPFVLTPVRPEFAAPAEVEPPASDPETEPPIIPVADAFAIAAPAERGLTGAWWTVPLMCAGLAVIAAAILIPAADENRQLAYEMAKIQRDVDHFVKQSAVNKDFLERIGNDPALIERLAQRQLRRPRENTRMIEMPKTEDAFAMSPAALVEIDPPAPLAPYSAPTGRLAEWCRDPKTRLYLLGGAMFAVALGVILGSSSKRSVVAST